MAVLRHSQTRTGTKTVAVLLSLVATIFTPTQGRVSAMDDSAPQTERSVDGVVNVIDINKATPSPKNVHINSRNLYNEVCWDAGGNTLDGKNVTFDAQYIDDKEYKTLKETWKFISDCKGVSGPCCTFFDEISVRDQETGKPVRPSLNGWWVRVRAVSTLGRSRWNTTSEWFSPYKHTVIGPPDVDVIAKPANQATSSAQQLRDLIVKIKHPITPYYRYQKYNQETMATMGDFEDFFYVFYNVSFSMDGHRENSRDFKSREDFKEEEEYSITGLRPGRVYCVEVTGFVHSLWVVRKGLPSKDVCQRTAEAKPSIGPTNVSWRPLPATNCSAETRSFRSIRVRWSPPPANEANGVITKYKVTITNNIGTSEHVTIRETVGSHIELSDLTTFHTYTIQPSACTSAGCTRGEQVRVPAHVINPMAPTNLRKTEVTSEEIVVTWFPPENEYDCVDVYKVRYVEVSGGTLRQVIVANTTAVLPALQPGTTYIVSVSAVYKRYGSNFPPVESPPTPWVTVSTGPQTTNFWQTAVVAAVGGACLVIALIVALYFRTTWNSGKTSEENLYDVSDADVLDEIKLYPNMSPITPRRQKGQHEEVDSWAKEMRALANFESLVRTHADLWVGPQLEPLGRTQSVGSDPDSIFTSSTTLGDVDSLENLQHSTRATSSDYSVISNWPNVTTENSGEVVNDRMEGDYAQHALAEAPSGHDTEMQSDAIAAKYSNESGYVTSEVQRAPVEDNIPSDYARVQHHSVATPSGCNVDKNSDTVIAIKSNDSGYYVTSKGQRAPAGDNITSDYARVQHHPVATPSSCDVDKHSDTVVATKSNDSGYVRSEGQREPVGVSFAIPSSFNMEAM